MRNILCLRRYREGPLYHAKAQMSSQSKLKSQSTPHTGKLDAKKPSTSLQAHLVSFLKATVGLKQSSDANKKSMESDF